MLGWKNSVRNVPVSSKMMNEYSAISPSRNVQWSGKTLRSRTRTPLAPWNLSSSALPTPSSARSMLIPNSSPLEETRANRLGEVAHRDQVAIGVRGHRQLRQRPRRRAEQHRGAARRVEGRLVARAEDVMRGLLVQRRRAADVRADLRIAHNVVDGPVHHRGRCNNPGRDLMMIAVAAARASGSS